MHLIDQHLQHEKKRVAESLRNSDCYLLRTFENLKTGIIMHLKLIYVKKSNNYHQSAPLRPHHSENFEEKNHVKVTFPNMTKHK